MEATINSIIMNTVTVPADPIIDVSKVTLDPIVVPKVPVVIDIPEPELDFNNIIYVELKCYSHTRSSDVLFMCDSTSND